MNSSWRCQKCDACLLQVHRKGVSRKKPNKNGIICHNWKLNEQKLAQVNFTLISGHKSGFNFTWKIILSFILKCSDLSDRGPLIDKRQRPAEQMRFGPETRVETRLVTIPWESWVFMELPCCRIAIKLMNRKILYPVKPASVFSLDGCSTDRS